MLAFFEELLCMLGYLFLASSKVYFTRGVVWLVGLLGLLRGGVLSLAFSVSINKLKIYEYHFMIHFASFGCWSF